MQLTLHENKIIVSCPFCSLLSQFQELHVGLLECTCISNPLILHFSLKNDKLGLGFQFQEDNLAKPQWWLQYISRSSPCKALQTGTCTYMYGTLYGTCTTLLIQCTVLLILWRTTVANLIRSPLHAPFNNGISNLLLFCKKRKVHFSVNDIIFFLHPYM